MKKTLSFILFFTLCLVAKSQTIIYMPRSENSTVTSNKMDNQRANIESAYKAYNEGDINKAKYFLSQSAREKWFSSGYFYLNGKIWYDAKKYRTAKKYLMEGYRKYACWECKEFIDKINAEKGADHPLGTDKHAVWDSEKQVWK